MNGLVIKDAHIRKYPTVNSEILGYLNTNDIVAIKDAVDGDEVDSDDEWYLLNYDYTAYVWSGAVELDSPLDLQDENDLVHYLISYRKIDPTQRPDDWSKAIPDKLSFQRLILPARYKELEMTEDEDEIIESLLKDLKVISRQRKHVMVYIPGYQPLPNLGLDLWSAFVQNYMGNSLSTIAKVLFFTWPNQELGRKTIDDRALEAGKKFAENRLYSFFVKLSERLSEKNFTLNLMVHSFGHQLINGFLTSPIAFAENSKIFHRIFLMAPDITQWALKPKGISLANFEDGKKGPLQEVHYNLNRLGQLTNTTHIFWDKYDYLLHTSTRKFAMPLVAKPQENYPISLYRTLGNFGMGGLEPTNLDGFIFHDLQEILRASNQRKKNQYFRFTNLMDKRKWRKKMDNLINGKIDYDKIGDLSTLVLNSGKFTRHHRYLFTSEAVVHKIIEILNKNH